MAKKKQRPFALFLCLLLCGFIILGPVYFMEYRPENRQEDPMEKEIKWRGVITLWDYPHLDVSNGSRYGWIVSKIKAFEKANPGVYIELKPMDSKTGPLELETAIQTGSLPDIAPVATDFAMIDRGVLEPIDAYLTKVEEAEYKTQALNAVRYDGKTWGFPAMMTTYTMLLNLDIFQEKGIDPPKDGNWTYEEFVETAKALTFDRDGNGKMDVYGFNSYIDLNNYNNWGILLSDGAQIFDDSLIYRFNDDRAKSGLKKLVDLKQVHGVTVPNFGENIEREAWESFYKEKKVAVYPVGTWAINVMNSLRNQGLGFQIGVANYPIGEKGVPISLSNNVSAYGIFKQEDPKKLEMCVKFLKYVTDDEFQKDLARLGVFPVKKSGEDIYQLDPLMATVEKSLAYCENLPTHPNWMTIDGILQSQIRLAILGNKTVEDALRDAQLKIETYNRITLEH
ncbi:extracellular solute-binding protein [Anaerosolibacter sp.]|uniref:extracellular solute-binding protein n=1 Tax=Anaerosolibacter sp. TaxID=1872527 RepID=UPI0039F10B35